ncbi:hypothetical protein EDD16DRAFT_1516364 [Pisolithus croceorrhizus]|nr:hypothetical protein EV401DRAFT_1888649 [Pisolithus croceorrhizus]KAI6128098.1 hypothetical protein EDD16DRAFT_1516364 [Pisolithus croceorrhizus]
MQELCMKPNKLSKELPNEEKLKDELTKVKEDLPGVSSKLHTALNKLNEQLMSRAGKTLRNMHPEVLYDMVKELGKVKNVDRKAKEDLPSKLCNGRTTNNVPSAHALPLKGEQAACPSSIIRQEKTQLRGGEEAQWCAYEIFWITYPHHNQIHPQVSSSRGSGLRIQGGTLEQPTAHNQAAKNKGRLSSPAKHADEVSGCMKQHVPNAHRVLLEGENASMPIKAPSSTNQHFTFGRPASPNEGHVARGVKGEITGGDGEPRDGKGKTTSSGNVDLEQVEAALLAGESQDAYRGQNKESQIGGLGVQDKVNEEFGDVEDKRKLQNDAE